MNKEQPDNIRPRGHSRRSRKKFVANIAPDYIQSTLPSRDMEIPTVTTVNTIRDYLEQDRAVPRDSQFADKIDIVPIPTKKDFIDTAGEIATFLDEIAYSQEGTQSPYILSTIQIGENRCFYFLQLQTTHISVKPARIILLPKAIDERTFGIFTTEKALRSSSVPIRFLLEDE